MFSLLALPEELLVEIFDQCGAADLKNVSLCNRAMYQLSKKSLWRSVKIPWKCVTHLNLRNSSTRKQMENLKYVKSVTFCDEKDNDYCSLFSEGWEHHYSKRYSDNYLKILKHFNPDMVKHLSINRGGEMIIHACKTFSKLSTLHLNRLLAYTTSQESCVPDQILELRELQHLHEIQWGESLQIPVSYQKAFFSSGKLQQLKLLVLPSLDHFVQLPNLQQLKLTSPMYGLGNSVSSISSVALTLRNLDLSHTSINDESLKNFPQLPSLEFLSLGSTHVTDVGIEFVSNITSLKYLDIEAIATDQCIFHLRKLTKLKGLVMSCYVLDVDNADDVKVPYLMRMTSLVYLDITSWRGQQRYGSDLLSVDAVKKLSCHPSLKRLATTYDMERFGGSCGRIKFVKSKHATYVVWRSGDDEPEMVESRFLNPDGWTIAALEKLIE